MKHYLQLIKQSKAYRFMFVAYAMCIYLILAPSSMVYVIADKSLIGAHNVEYTFGGIFSLLNVLPKDMRHDMISLGFRYSILVISLILLLFLGSVIADMLFNSKLNNIVMYKPTVNTKPEEYIVTYEGHTFEYRYGILHKVLLSDIDTFKHYYTRAVVDIKELLREDMLQLSEEDGAFLTDFVNREYDPENFVNALILYNKNMFKK